MGKIVNLRMRNLPLPKGKDSGGPAVRSAMSLRRAKDAVLSESNRIAHEHGHFRASAAGKPTLVYGQGHDMKKHGEGKPLNLVEKAHQVKKQFAHLPDKEPVHADEIERQLAEHFGDDKDK